MPTQSNDLTGQYMKSRQSANLTPAQMRRASQAGEAAQVVDVVGKSKFSLSPQFQAGKTTGETIAAVTKDVARGAVEVPKQVVGGVISAAKEAGSAVESLIEFFGAPSVLQITNEQGEFDLDLVSREEFKEAGGERIADIVTPGEAKSTTGGLVRGVAQFLTGFLPAAKLLKGVGPATKLATVGRAAAAGAVADATVFDPHEERMSNLVERFPTLQNPVTGYLEAQPDDTEAEGRFKNVVEGLGLGVLSEGFFAATKAVRASRLKKLEAKEAAAEAATVEKFAGLDEEIPAVEPAQVGEVPAVEPVAAAPKEPAFKVGSKKADAERALNINLENVETTDEVKNLIEGVGEKFAPDINEARREIITREETKKLADDLGMTVDDLLNRRRGEAFNAEQAVAARRILVASGENLVGLAKKAVAGSEEEIVLFRRALSQHHAIQSQVSGLTAEAGRALQSFNIKAKGGKARQQQIKDILDAGGGAENSKVLAGMVSSLDNPQQLNQFVKGAQKATTREMLYEAWINGLLSSPATHTVNVIGNSLTAAWAVGERKVASAIGGTLDRQNIPKGEATAMLYGMANGAKDGMRLAWDALKTGEPSDILTKQESAGFKSITGENLNLTGTPGRFADYMGEAVRMPGRFLTAGDEFFKTMGYRMELHAQAFRQATGEGLEGEALASRVYDIIQNPPENIDLASIDFSRYTTFTKPLGEAGQAVQSAVKAIPGAKVIIPFIRTPTNIVKYVGERTPLSFIAPAIRDEIAAGGARRDMALAKIGTGSMIMAAAADFTLSDQITGAGPTNPAMRNLLRSTGWQPYSLKIGDTYISYNRLDPVGATIGIAADIAEITAQTADADAMDLATSAVVSVAQNVTSKTYLSGLADFFEVMSSVSPDPEVNNTRARKWVERLAGTAVPSGVAQLERTLSPELSATQGIIEKLKSRIPGFSDDLPPRRNIFGEPIVLSGGIGPDIMSPLYTSTDKKDAIADEIVAQQAMLRMPRPVIDGVKLDTKMYDSYIKFYAGTNNRFVKQPLKSALRELFSTNQYRQATDGQEGGKSVLIRATFDGYREAAKQMMREKAPALAAEARQLKTEKFRKLGGKI